VGGTEPVAANSHLPELHAIISVSVHKYRHLRRMPTCIGPAPDTHHGLPKRNAGTARLADASRPGDAGYTRGERLPLPTPPDRTTRLQSILCSTSSSLLRSVFVLHDL
jgi:hypothetical protein